MVGNYKIITLCGSSRFKDEFYQVQKKLTLAGNIVLTLGMFSQSDVITITEQTKQMLADMHKKKIDLSDEIYVINKNGYIGESTKSEIKYAIETHKNVNYLE